MKKSQITIFIVLGIVIMIIFGLLFFVSRQTSDLVLEKRINKIYGDFLSSTGIKEYISNCLEISTKNAIKLAALQGGKIYDYQVSRGHNITSTNEVVPFNYTGENPNGIIYNVSYGIKAPNIILPNYPYAGELIEDPLSKYNLSPVFALKESDPLNTISLTSLCNYYGPNIPHIINASYSCETKTRSNISIQQYLKDFIINRTKRCVNFPQFKSQTKYNVSEGKIDGFVLIGNDDLFVNIRYPIDISIEGKPPRTKFLEFTSRQTIRLKKVHELAAHLIGWRIRRTIPKADANNIFFNITRDDPHDCIPDNETGRQDCILDGMEVNKIKDYCLNNPLCDYLPDHYRYSDIINITDKNSIIDGKPLTFLFAVENRAPALNFTPNIAVNQGEEIEFFALDPDEDELTYSIDDNTFNPIEENKFEAPSVTDSYNIIINVSDNEGLYDYQHVTITVS